jgi:hypothetical protein
MFYPPIIKLLTRNTSMNRNFPVPADWRVGLRSSLIYIQGHFLAIHLEFSKLPRNECSLNHGPSPWPIPMASFVPMPQSLRIQVLAASLAAWASLAGALAAQAVAQAALGEGRASQAHRAAHQPGRGGAGDQEVGEATSNPANLHQLWDQHLAKLRKPRVSARLIQDGEKLRK